MAKPEPRSSARPELSRHSTSTTASATRPQSSDPGAAPESVEPVATPVATATSAADAMTDDEPMPVTVALVDVPIARLQSRPNSTSASGTGSPGSGASSSGWQGYAHRPGHEPAVGNRAAGNGHVGDGVALRRAEGTPSDERRCLVAGGAGDAVGLDAERFDLGFHAGGDSGVAAQDGDLGDGAVGLGEEPPCFVVQLGGRGEDERHVVRDARGRCHGVGEVGARGEIDVGDVVGGELACDPAGGGVAVVAGVAVDPVAHGAQRFGDVFGHRGGAAEDDDLGFGVRCARLKVCAGDRRQECLLGEQQRAVEGCAGEGVGPVLA